MTETCIVIPAYNEQETLTEKVTELNDFLTRKNLDSDIIIADNNSTDSTGMLAKNLAYRNNRIKCYFVPEKGKGSAIKRTWLAYNYTIYSFMDEDLSADLEYFPQLIDKIKNGYDMAIGSRYIPGAESKRNLKRRIISRTYRTLFNLLFDLGIHDPQCGFKAISRNIRDNVIPKIEDDGFFFDTELLLRANHAGYKIKEVPIKWVEDPSSTVNMCKDIPKFLYGLARLKYQQMTGKL